MFEKLRARRTAARQQHQQAEADRQAAHELDEWQHEHDHLKALIDEATGPGATADGLVLHRGEVCVGVLTGCSLIEERRGRGHYEGGSAGVSVPLGSVGGHSVRYRVGATRGHYVQGEPVATAVAQGTLFLTSQRFCFLGATQTRECALPKLVGLTRDDEHGSLTMSVSNRQHPIVVAYGPKVADWVAFHVGLALARFNDGLDAFVDPLKAQLAELEANKPSQPLG